MRNVGRCPARHRLQDHFANKVDEARDQSAGEGLHAGEDWCEARLQAVPCGKRPKRIAWAESAEETADGTDNGIGQRLEIGDLGIDERPTLVDDTMVVKRLEHLVAERNEGAEFLKDSSPAAGHGCVIDRVVTEYETEHFEARQGIGMFGGEILDDLQDVADKFCGGIDYPANRITECAKIRCTCGSAR